MRYPRRIIEVDLPIKRISAHARREKSIRHGHISTLHIWWARRPLAACRAVICASLWPDPADELCPAAFIAKAREVMLEWSRRHLNLLGQESQKDFIRYSKKPALLDEPLGLRNALLHFIADFANWDNSTVSEYLDSSRALTQAAHECLGGAPGTRPLVVDPFAGGGSIPLEALRVGADAFASDLNPVPVLLNKVVLEYIPKYGQRLADEVRKWGQWINENIESDLRKFYPLEGDGSEPVGYIWARTILSESPDGGETPIEIPVLRSMWLCSKPKRRFAFRWLRDAKGRVRTETVQVTFADGTTRNVRRPLIEIFTPASVSEVEKGTSSGGTATCPVTGFTMPVERVREQLKRRSGGGSDARLLCVVTTPNAASGRVYRLPGYSDLNAAAAAQQELHKLIKRHKSNVTLVPNGNLNHLRGFFNVVLYGMETWGDLFTPRQALSLSRLVELVSAVSGKFQEKDLGIAVQTCLAMVLGRCADKCASVVVWNIPAEKIEHVFGRQALPMVWDFAEANILSDIGWRGAVEWVCKVVDSCAAAKMQSGSAAQASAIAQTLPRDSADAVITDPPYYAAIPYADLSDFFYSWFKRSVGNLYPDLFSADLSPKDEECVQLSHRAAMYRHKDAAWFEQMMTRACAQNRDVTKPSGVSVVVFANKETAGWEAMLTALISSGWVITGSWPIDTERQGRLRAMDSAALASSVHLVCRPRENPEGSVRTNEIGDWRDVLQELPGRIHDWMPRLADEGVVGADAIFACLGPALEIFSRYSRVEKASGEAVTLREYLEQVWAAVAREALTMIFTGADTTGFEEDARLTAMWLWTLNAGRVDGESDPNEDDADSEDEQDSGSKSDGPKSGFVLEYDAARKIAQGLGAHLEQMSSLVEVRGEKARLRSVGERAGALFARAKENQKKKAKKKESKHTLFAAVDGEIETETEIEVDEWNPGGTTLDKIHQTMILFAAGRGEAVKRIIVDEGAGKDGKFWKLAQALSALYPAGSNEKRWIDGVLARKKGFGF